MSYDFELGAAPKKAKKKKKKKAGAKIKAALKKVGKGVAVVATGGVALAGMKPKKLLAKAKGKVSKLKSKAKGVLTKLKTKPKLAAKAKVAVKALKAGASPKSASILAKVATKRPGDCSDKSDLARTVAAQLALQLSPKLDQANALLGKFDLQRKVTHEHKRLMSEADFRREVLSLLALKAANGNLSCQRTLRTIRAGR